jgi:anti-sigma factor RsiW
MEKRVASSVPPRPKLWRVFAAAAVVLLLAAAAWWQPWRGKADASLVAAMELDHREFLAGEFGPAFNGPPPPEVLAAAHGRVDAPAFAALPIGDGFTIEGSRLCHLSGVPVAWTLVRYQGRPVSWVALRREELAHFPDVRDALAAGRAVVVLRAGDYQFTARRVGDHVVCALGDLPAETLTTLLETVPTVPRG